MEYPLIVNGEPVLENGEPVLQIEVWRSGGGLRFTSKPNNYYDSEAVAIRELTTRPDFDFSNVTRTLSERDSTASFVDLLRKRCFQTLNPLF